LPLPASSCSRGGLQQCHGPPPRLHYPPKTTSRKVHLSISVFTSHAACCLLVKTQVPPAGYQYRPLDVRLATAHTVPSYCMSHRHVADLPVTPHSQLTPSIGHIITSWAKDTSCFQGVKGRLWPAYSICMYATLNTTFLRNLLKMTVFPLLQRRKRSAQTGGRGGLRNYPQALRSWPSQGLAAHVTCNAAGSPPVFCHYHISW
jgi:hypothetical protein